MASILRRDTGAITRPGTSSRAKAEKEYRQFVKRGIDKETIWTAVKGQAILGEDDFVNSFADHLKRHKDIPEIPKSQRFASRPTLEKIFKEGILADKGKGDRKKAEAIDKFGYTQLSLPIIWDCISRT